MGRRKIDMSDAQRRRLFALARELGFEGKEALQFLREQAAQWTGQCSLSSLSHRQANEMFAALQQSIGKQPEFKKPVSPGRLSFGQLHLIRELYPQIFNGRPEFLSWLKNYYKIDLDEWLTPALAGKVIEGLKAQLKRQKETALER